MWIVVRAAGVVCLVYALSAVVSLTTNAYSYVAQRSLFREMASSKARSGSVSGYNSMVRALPVVTSVIALIVYVAAGVYLLRGGELVVKLACGQVQNPGEEEAQRAQPGGESSPTADVASVADDGEG
jgi:hypothetical protein